MAEESQARTLTTHPFPVASQLLRGLLVAVVEESMFFQPVVVAL
jgi:hypothetical protein